MENVEIKKIIKELEVCLFGEKKDRFFIINTAINNNSVCFSTKSRKSTDILSKFFKQQKESGWIQPDIPFINITINGKYSLEYQLSDIISWHNKKLLNNTLTSTSKTTKIKM